MATPTPKIELGLGGSFYGTLMNESSLVGLWPNDIYGVLGFWRDMNSGARDLTLSGTISPGNDGPLPEGGTSASYAPGGYASRNDSALKPSNVTFVCLFKAPDVTTTQMIGGTGPNGYRMMLDSGTLLFSIQAAGSAAPAVSVSADTWYLAIGRYDGANVKVEVTGITSQITTTASSALTGAISYSATNFRLANNDGLTAPYTGYIQGAAVCSSAISDASVALIRATTLWTDVSADWRCNEESLRATYGIQGNGPLDRVGSPGTMTFTLDDSAANSGAKLGYYSPGHANCRGGFTVGIPARLTVTYNGVTYRKWVGKVNTITPRPGKYLSRATDVACVDWFDYANLIPFKGISAQANTTSRVAMIYAYEMATGHTPNGISIPTVGDTFEYVFDSTGQGTPLLSEMARVTLSEFGAIYLRHNENFPYGNQLHMESRGTRETKTTNDVTFAEADILNVEYTRDASLSYNDVRVTVTPRNVDSAATSVLYTLQGTQQIGAGESVTIEAAYRDPNQQAAKVGGIEMVTPVATTDYTMNTASNGSGTDLTANLSLSATFGGSSASIVAMNTGAAVGYITKLQLRGKGIYIYNPFTVQRTNATKIATRGPRVLEFEIPYQSNISFGQSIANILLTAFDGAPAFVNSVMTQVNRSSTTVGANILSIEPGYRIGLTETVTGLDGTTGYYVQNVDMEIRAGSILFVRFGLAPALASGNFWVLGTTGASELDSTTVLAY